MVPLDGPLHGVEQFGAALVIAPHLLVLVQGDAGPVGQEPDGVDKIEVVHGPHKGDGVAGLLAAEAVVEALLGVHAERGRLLRVERTQPDPAPANLLQGGVLADQLHDVRGRPDLGYFLVRYPHRHDGTAVVSSLRPDQRPFWPSFDPWPSPFTASVP